MLLYWPGYVRDVLNVRILKPGCGAEMGDYFCRRFVSIPTTGASAYRARIGRGCGRYGQVGYITLGSDMDRGLSVRRYVEGAGSVRGYSEMGISDSLLEREERGGGRAPGDEEDDGIYDWG